MSRTSDAYDRAVDLLRRAAGPAGFVASPHEHANYRRVWARDGVVVGLAALASGDASLIATFQRTLETLAGQQGPHGEIPSNVLMGADGRAEHVSYGGLVGRVDAPAWFVLGVTELARHTGDRGLVQAMARPVERALQVMTAWEHNLGGLMYVPQGGSWADEYVISGYELGVQLLRLWALRGHAAVMDDDGSARAAERLTELIRVNYWPRPAHVGSPLVRHPVAYQAVIDGLGEDAPPSYWLSTLRPGGYERRFDALANALAMMLGVSGPDHDDSVHILAEADRVAAELGTDLVPAFWPPVREGDPAWPALQVHRRGEFRNRPGAYHNGGLWPMVNGFWGLALVVAGFGDRAAALCRSLAAFNRRHAEPGREWGFYEFGHAHTRAPMGVRECTWSAAGMILLQRALEGVTPGIIDHAR